MDIDFDYLKFVIIVIVLSCYHIVIIFAYVVYNTFTKLKNKVYFRDIFEDNLLMKVYKTKERKLKNPLK